MFLILRSRLDETTGVPLIPAIDNIFHSQLHSGGSLGESQNFTLEYESSGALILLLIWGPKGAHQTKSVLGYAGSYKNICAKAS